MTSALSLSGLSGATAKPYRAEGPRRLTTSYVPDGYYQEDSDEAG